MTQIPKDVLQAAHAEYFKHVPIITAQDGDDARARSYEVVARWARGEALHEAADKYESRWGLGNISEWLRHLAD